MKLNNKGMTLVELIVTFSLLLVIVIGLYNLIIEIRFEVNDREVAKELNEFSSTTNNTIHYDLVTAKPSVIAIKNSSSSNWSCKSISGGNCTFNGNRYVFTVNGKVDEVTIDELNGQDFCNNIFPCAVYYYVDGNTLAKHVIALNKGDKNNSLDSLKVNGVLYDGIYERVPNDNYVEIRDVEEIDSSSQEVIYEVSEDDRIYFSTDDGLFIINYPFYIIDRDKNYGFKIVYPFS